MSLSPVNASSAEAPLEVDPLVGLSEAEAAARLLAEGANEVPRSDKRTTLRILVEVLKEPMLALLLVGAGLYFAIGDRTEAIILGSFAMFSVVITLVQEVRTEHVLESLRDLSSPRALVVRDGVRRRIAGREVVRGDLVVVEEGDRVPADSRIIVANGLLVDESLLTGESIPVQKLEGLELVEGAAMAAAENAAFVYAGTLVVRGSAVASVCATGAKSQLGQIGKLIGEIEDEPPRLRVQTQRIVMILAVIGVAVSLTAVLLYGLLRGSWLDAALAGIALGMSMLPEELPVVLTVFMAMGAWRISKLRVLTRHAATIETLGAATVLCTDKTGTLTRNRMAIAELRLADGAALHVGSDSATILPTPFERLAEIGILACAPDSLDPMEMAFHLLGEQQAQGRVTRCVDAGYRLHRHYPLEKPVLAMANVWGQDVENGAGDEHPKTLAVKGAPETLIELCHLSGDEAAQLRLMVDEMAREGLRVLAVGEAIWKGKDLPQAIGEADVRLIGLVGLADPLRASVPQALALCHTAGIRVMMITGDYPVTARAIARQAGIVADEVMTGAELAALDDEALAQRVRQCCVFARIMPEQKLRIVAALKAGGEVVAMTGDGVNDAPALKSAHIGIAMGGRGTDVAREAASMVLLDDDFGSIVASVRMGRRIYDNLRKAAGFILAVHVPIAGLALIPLLFGLPLLLGPIHIAFLEMIIDPVCSLAFEAETEEKDVMERPPRPPEAQLMSRALVMWALLQGAVALGLNAAVVAIGVARGLAADDLRGLVFMALVLTILALILINRSFGTSIMAAVLRPNPALAYVVAGVVAILAAAQFFPVVGHLFGFAPLHGRDMIMALAAGLGALFVLEAIKPLLRGRLAG
ncbi:cation-translocating P-type ATPase [Aquisediminimonas sediminicola]|uniref:cation-translocating P-type ATPase n=1 Tax=Alteraquisediminimonas sediminicola TaxID=2676787 RepID=UPI001C8D8DD7|nr:cation-translocating P-type ATPase [Aquisediminimonas sediminicola]